MLTHKHTPTAAASRLTYFRQATLGTRPTQVQANTTPESVRLCVF